MVLRLALLLWSTALVTPSRASAGTDSTIVREGVPPVQGREVSPRGAKGATESESTKSKFEKPDDAAEETDEVSSKPVPPPVERSAPQAERETPSQAPSSQPAGGPTGAGGADLTVDADRPAAEPKTEIEEGIWSWLERIDGEIVPEKAKQQIETDAEAEIVERTMATNRGVDVPLDFYNDPAAALAGDALYLDQINPADFDIPIEINEHVIAKLRMFLGPHRKYIEKWLERKSRYEPMIREELTKAGLPQDLIYLSMIESGFNPYAYSSAHAAGLWQFIPTTGQYYGLDVDWWMDERRDPEMATKAALKMLGELNKMFGHWHLAFAAYNTGPGRIRSALANARKDDQGKVDYWDLLAQDLLHSETEGYVPKIVAAAIIGHYPERYGFVNLHPEAPLTYDTVKVDGVVDVGVLAKCAGMDEESFRMLNPSIRRYATPEGSTDIRVPRGGAEGFSVALAKVPAEERLQIVQHKVRRGETLSIIAGQYGVSSKDIASANGIRNPNIIEVGQYLVVPMRGSASSVAASQPVAVISTTRSPSEPASDARASTAPSTPRPSTEAARTSTEAPRPSTSTTSYSTHKVRSGETLTTIADRYNVSLSDIQRWNGIGNSNHIEVGQVLKVKPSTTTSSSSSSSSSTAAPSKPLFTHTVTRGETMAILADRYRVSVSDLSRWNGVRDADTIEVGQVLKFYGGKAPSVAAAPTGTTSYYKVRSGDTLSAIADRYNVSMSEMQKWNGIRNPSDIKVGQTLKIYKGGSASSSSSSSSAATWISYTVRGGDSLGAIAEKYHVTVSDLRSWNRLSTSTIYPGQKLKVKTSR